jgi:ParB-like chromosome segregation protein Spo0J
MARLATLSRVINEGPMDPAERLAVQLVENAAREALTPPEKARAYRRPVDSQGWRTSD